METKIVLTGYGIEDNNFRCFYKVYFENEMERKDFVAHLHNQPDDWSACLAWVVDPKNNMAEAYIMIDKEKKDQFLTDLHAFVLNEEPPKLSLRSKIWRTVTKPYWWWKTRHLAKTV